jgi:leucyl-tRNA synthetase
VWRLGQEARQLGDQPAEDVPDEGLQRVMHKTIRRVSEEIEMFKFNTAIAALMEYVNILWPLRDTHGRSIAYQQAFEVLIRLLAPFAPYIVEEIWAQRGNNTSIHQQPWPTYNPALIIDETITMVIQVNGRVRDRMVVPVGISEQDAEARALKSTRVQDALNHRSLKRTIVVPDRLVNLVA